MSKTSQSGKIAAAWCPLRDGTEICLTIICNLPVQILLISATRKSKALGIALQIAEKDFPDLNREAKLALFRQVLENPTVFQEDVRLSPLVLQMMKPRIFKKLPREHACSIKCIVNATVTYQLFMWRDFYNNNSLCPTPQRGTEGPAVDIV
jgi:hypothetical protein